MKHFLRHYLFYFFIPVLAFACSPMVITKSDLRVGTTGDYPPLTSFDSTSGKFQGEDIDMALRLGKHFGQRVIFIKTTWKELNTDLLAKKFDIAIGGISVNTTREKLFSFSTPLLTERKVAVFRIADRSKFKDFNAIDQPGIRIIENIGGTNELFAKKNIRQATIDVIPDNQQVFKILLNNKADVMFTDETEAKYQQTKHPDLFWLKLDAQISPAYKKAIMFNKSDTLLQLKVNTWLKHQ
ncbi:transporter substrate-binding domain-containing protein [Pedobacter sp. PAMC26386]|nr:transporter substrate-binding domain-containing protein [Pedobacter sp. PAMC26386]